MKKILLIIQLLFLASCAKNINSSWNCPLPKSKAGNCINISTADNFSKNMIVKNQSDIKQNNPALKIIGQDHNLDSDLAVNRSGEKISMIRFAAFIDDQNNYHAESIIYVVDYAGSWGE